MNEVEYFKGKPKRVMAGMASPAKGTPTKTSIYADSPNQLARYGGDQVEPYGASAKTMKKPKGY